MAFFGLFGKDKAEKTASSKHNPSTTYNPNLKGAVEPKEQVDARILLCRNNLAEVVKKGQDDMALRYTVGILTQYLFHNKRQPIVDLHIRNIPSIPDLEKSVNEIYLKPHNAGKATIDMKKKTLSYTPYYQWNGK